MAEAVRERKKGSPGGTTSDPQKEQRKKTALAALVMLVPFCAGMYLIFGSGGQDETPGAGNINLTVPDGRSAGIEASKQKAIENVRMQQRQQERSLAFDKEDFSLLADAPAKVRPSQEEALARSQQANRQATEMMQSFYERPKKDPEVERLQKQVEELSGQLQQAAATPDPMELAERQFQLAAKYLNPQGGTAERPVRNTVPQDKGQAVPVRALGDGTVSSLAVPVADSLRPEGERNLSFITAVGSSQDKEHSSIRACVDEVAAKYGKIDVLFNVAGINKREGLLDVEEADYDRIMDTNLKGLFFMSQAVAREMYKRRTGSIVNIGSHNDEGMLGGCSVYGATKSGVVALTRAMAVEFAQYGIRANAISPGHILTDLTQVTWDHPTRAPWLRERIAMKRPGNPEELVGMAILLASDASSYMTGQAYHIDGGCLCGGAPWDYDTQYKA